MDAERSGHCLQELYKTSTFGKSEYTSAKSQPPSQVQKF